MKNNMLSSRYLCFLTISIWGLFCTLCSPLLALEPQQDLRKGPTVTVTHVGYGASFDLSDGKRVRLLSLRVPKPNAPPFERYAEPLGEQAKEFVEDFVKGHSITLYFDKNDTDRHGRWLAHVVRDDGVWLQKALLEAGLARIYSFPDNRWGLQDMLQMEAHARQANRGIWALPHYATHSPLSAHKAIGTFQIVEGTVLHQNSGKKTIYLNFGKNWKTDFTIRIIKRNHKYFTDGIPEMQGKRVRARGWVIDRNGPLMDISHPEQIEILKD